MSEEETFRCEKYNVPVIIHNMSKCCTWQDEPLDPMDVVEMDEALEIWDEVMEKDGEQYFFTDDTLQEFLGRLQALALDITLKNLVDDGLVEMGHDGKDICYWLKKEFQ